MNADNQEPNLIWWLQDQDRQNFGDYLTDFLWSRLANGMRAPADGYRLLGSAISDWIVHDDLSKLGKWEHGRIVFWCCGMRDDSPLSAETLARSLFFGVRGPLTRAALKLPQSTVIGDPGLLLPLLHQPQRAQRTAGKTICAPHFHETTTDEDLRKLTGADEIVRPAIAKSYTALKDLLDEIASADFVLAGSLHAAIVACAYDVPFCYFDAGHLDVPFKWRDFSASVNIGTFFVDNVAEGRQAYELAIKPRLRKPLLFPILAAAPFIVHTQYLLAAALHDSQQIGDDRPLATEVLARFADAANEGSALYDHLALTTESAAHAATRIVLARAEQERTALSTKCESLERERDALADAMRRAERRAERDAARIELAEAMGQVERERERAAARAEFELERDAARVARAEQHLLMSQIAEDRLRFARDLDKAYRRPWKPGKAWAKYILLKSLAFAATPFSARASERFEHSAQKRSPRRYKKILAGLMVPQMSPESEPTPLLAPQPETVQSVPQASTESEPKPVVAPEPDPLALFIEHCQKSAPLAPPVYDAAVVPDVSIIVRVYNKWEMTLACLNSVVLTSADSDVRYEIILADDGSTDETAKAAEIFPGLRVLRAPAKLGVLRNCNKAAAHARGRYLLFLNNDTIVLAGWLKALYQAMENDPDMAIAGSKLLYRDGHIQEAGASLLRDGSASNFCRRFDRNAPIANVAREVDCVASAPIIVRADFWKAVGGFDDRYRGASFAASDLAMSARMRGGYVSYQPASEAILFDHEAPLDQSRSSDKDLSILHEKWRDVFARDHLPVHESPMAAANGQRRVPAQARTRRQSGKLNILYFSPFPSHPSSHGNQATIQQFARRFQSLGHKVHFALLCSGMYDEAAEQAMRETWDTFDILNNTRQLWSDGKEIPFDHWYQEGLGEEVHLLCEKYDIDLVFCSYVFQSKLLKFVPSHVLKVIDTHDKMGGRYDMLRANGQLLEFFSCSHEEEGAYLRRADVVVARRAEEARYFNSVTGRDTAIVIPHVEDPRFVEKSFERLANVGLVASQNRINLAIVKEFLETVARRRSADCSFTVHIAGQVKDMVEELPPGEASAFRAPWVRLHGFVPDIGSFYNEMDLIVSPVTMGTGINVKTVQAMAYGMPLLTTRWGSKGIETDDPMQNYADVDSLVSGLLTLVEKPEELNRLAGISRDRYASFYEEAISGMREMFAHEKLRDAETEKDTMAEKVELS